MPLDLLERPVEITHADRNPLQDRLLQSVKSLTVRADQTSALNATSGYALDPVPRLPINAWKMRVHMSATQSVPGTGEPATVVNLNTIDFDTANGFDTTTHQYTIPISGWYQVNAKCHMTVGVWGYVGMAASTRTAFASARAFKPMRVTLPRLLGAASSRRPATAR